MDLAAQQQGLGVGGLLRNFASKAGALSLPAVREALGQGEEEAYRLLLAESNGTPTGAMLQSDINRGVLPGQQSPWHSILSNSEAAKIDRYTWGKQAGLGGIPTAIYSELVKVPAIQKPMAVVTRGLGKVLGYPQAEEWYKPDEHTSPPSLANIDAYIRGALNR